MSTLVQDYFQKKIDQIRETEAPTRGVTCNISVSNLIDLWANQEEKCLLTGRKLTFDEAWPDACSVDLLDPRKGYEWDNMRLITAQASAALGPSGDNPLISFALDVLRTYHEASRPVE